MKQKIKTVGLLIGMLVFTACVPAPQPQPNFDLGRGIGSAQGSTRNSTIENTKENTKQPEVMGSAYGIKPHSYVRAIRNYFKTKVVQGKKANYKFGEPKRAYRRKGFAYGGDIDWKGWLVETSVATQSRTGRWLTPKPYMVLFSGEQVVDYILGNSHKLVIKVDK